MSSETEMESENIIESSYNVINNVLLNPNVIIIVVIILFIYVAFFAFLGNDSMSVENTNIGMNMSNGSSYSTIGMIVVAILVILLLVKGLDYFFGIDIIANIRNAFIDVNPVTEIDTRIESAKGPIPTILRKQQVFNIPENEFTYTDAKAVCSAYGARLASYAELEEAYNQGGEWCNYGWSDNQMALFPTQQKTFDGLQKIEGHENDCGRPGINGGYMKNPALRFGANCYGYKPRMTDAEEERMATDPIYPKTKKDQAMEERVNYWKDKLTTLLVSPFNNTNWSQV